MGEGSSCALSMIRVSSCSRDLNLLLKSRGSTCSGASVRLAFSRACAMLRYDRGQSSACSATERLTTQIGLVRRTEAAQPHIALGCAASGYRGNGQAHDSAVCKVLTHKSQPVPVTVVLAPPQGNRVIDGSVLSSEPK